MSELKDQQRGRVGVNHIGTDALAHILAYLSLEENTQSRLTTKAMLKASEKTTEIVIDRDLSQSEWSNLSKLYPRLRKITFSQLVKELGKTPSLIGWLK